MTTELPESEETLDPLSDRDASAIEMFNALLGFKVEDACEPGDKDIFVLESPHLHEMMYLRMLAGDSGVAVSNCLLGKTKSNPFGLFGVEPWPAKPKALQGIGALNACLFPMQSLTYGPAQRGLPGMKKALDALRLTRKGPEGRRDDDWNREFEGLIVAELAGRIIPLIGEGVVFRPCGKVARGLLVKARKLIGEGSFYISAKEIPHPSYNAWKGRSRREVLAPPRKGP